MLLHATLLLYIWTATVQSKSVAVKGKLLCGPYPAGQILIRLWKADSGEDDDKLLGQTFSDSDGNFSLVAGDESELGWAPVLSVHHDCDDAKNAGRRKLNFFLPASYVDSSETPKRTFDLGVFNLEARIQYDEERVDEITKRRRRRKIHSGFARNITSDSNESPEDRIEPW